MEDFTEFQIYLKSRQGDSSNNDPSTVEFNFSNRPVIVASDKRISLNVQFASIKVTWFNVNSYNNVLVVNGTTYTITPANYNVYTLATEISYLIATLSITCTYNDTSNQYTFSSDADDFTFSNSTTADELLGLDFSNADTLSSTDNVYYATLIADLSYTTSIYITSPNLLNESRDSYSVSSISDIIASVQVTVNSTGIIYFTGYTRTILYRNIIDRFTIIIKDENNNVLQMNGGWWNMTLDIKIVPHQLITTTNNMINNVGIII